MVNSVDSWDRTGNSIPSAEAVVEQGQIQKTSENPMKRFEYPCDFWKAMDLQK